MIKGGRTNQFSKHKRIMAWANLCRLATELECNVGAAITKDFDSQQDLYDEKKDARAGVGLGGPTIEADFEPISIIALGFNICNSWTGIAKISWPLLPLNVAPSL